MWPIRLWHLEEAKRFSFIISTKVTSSPLVMEKCWCLGDLIEVEANDFLWFHEVQCNILWSDWIDQYLNYNSLLFLWWDEILTYYPTTMFYTICNVFPYYLFYFSLLLVAFVLIGLGPFSLGRFTEWTPFYGRPIVTGP